MLWELTGVAFVDMMEQESGQLLIDRTRSREALEVLMFYAFHQPRMIEQLDVAWGDKDLYRLAWMRTNTDFHMISHVPGSTDMQKTSSASSAACVRFVEAVSICLVSWDLFLVHPIFVASKLWNWHLFLFLGQL